MRTVIEIGVFLDEEWNRVEVHERLPGLPNSTRIEHQSEPMKSKPKEEERMIDGATGVSD
jgi:hypothetical protein